MKKVFATICLLLFVFSFPVIAKSFFNTDTVYYSYSDGELKKKSKKRADYYKVVQYFENDLIESRYYENKTDIFLYNQIYQNGIPRGKWYKGDILTKDYEYKYDIIDTAFENNNPLPRDSSKEDSETVKENINFTKLIVSRFSKYMEYPIKARENDLQERVIVRFHLNKDGILVKLSAYPCNHKIFTDEIVAIFAPLINQKLYFGDIKNQDKIFNFPFSFKLN